MGKAVWGGYSGENSDDAMNANANFLATDGVAAMGIWGVLLVSILFYFLLFRFYSVFIKCFSFYYIVVMWADIDNNLSQIFNDSILIILVK